MARRSLRHRGGPLGPPGGLRAQPRRRRAAVAERGVGAVGALEVAGADSRDEALEALARRRGPGLVVGLDRRALGGLEEAIGGANDRRVPVSARSVDGERVQVALRLVALRQLGRVGAPQGVGLVVDHQGALGELGQQVDLPAHDRSPQPERERDLGPDSRAACLELRAKLRGEPALDQRLYAVAGLAVARPAPRAPGSSPAPRRWAGPKSVARSPRGQRAPRCRSPATARAAPRRERGSRRSRGARRRRPRRAGRGRWAPRGRSPARRRSGSGSRSRWRGPNRRGGRSPRWARTPRAGAPGGEAALRRRPGRARAWCGKARPPARGSAPGFAPQAAAGAPGTGRPRSPAPARAPRALRRPSQPRPPSAGRSSFSAEWADFGSSGASRSDERKMPLRISRSWARETAT